MSSPQPDQEIALGDFERSEAGFKRRIGLWQLIAIAVTIQIGASWLLASLATANLAGPAAILTWIFGGLAFAVMAIPWIEASTALPRTGVSVRGPQFTHGSVLGWMNGWGYMIACLTLPPIEAVAALTYLGGRFPELGLLQVVDDVTVLTWPGGIVVAILLIAVFFLLNIFGAKVLAETGSWLSFWKVTIPIVAAILMFTAFNSANFTQYGGFLPLGAGAVFHALTTGGVVMAFNGIRVIADFGGESVNPRRHIPIAIGVGGLLIPLIIYLALQIGFLGVLDWPSLGLAFGDWEGLAGSDWAAAPLMNAVAMAGFGWFATILLIDAVGAPAVTGLAFVGISGRTTYANAVNGSLPQVFQRMNTYGVPWVAMLVSTVIGLVFLLPAPSWYQMVGIVSTALVISYLMGSPLVTVLRRTAPDLTRPIRLPAARTLCYIAHAIALVVIYYAGWWTLINLTTTFFLGVAVVAAHLGPNKGWFSKPVGVAVGAAFTVAWLVLAALGGWVMTSSAAKRGGSLDDGLYLVLLVIVLAVTGAVLWWVSNGEGRRHIGASVWLQAALLVTLLASYGSDPETGHGTGAWATWAPLVVVAFGVVNAAWADRSGFRTEEIAAVIAAEEAQQATSAPTRTPDARAGKQSPA